MDSTVIIPPGTTKIVYADGFLPNPGDKCMEISAATGTTWVKTRTRKNTIHTGRNKTE